MHLSAQPSASSVQRSEAGQRGRRRRLASLATVLLALLATLLSAPSAHAGHLPAIWVGAPTPGTWGVPGDWGTTPGGGHHKLVKASPGNDWSVDLSSTPSGDRGVYLYAAPSNSAYNNRVTARVTQIIDDNACRYGGGGDLVTVGLYFDGVIYGRATYAHIDRDPGLWVGKTIPRWGAWVGNVSWLSGSATGGSNCWTGPHLHFEMRAESHYACWNRGYNYAGYPISRPNFLGFVSGPLNPSYATPCP